ncbi:MAG: tetratricopeptide repeat protein [Arenimonas sp.]
MIFRVLVLGLFLLSESLLAEPLSDEKSQTVAAVMAAEYALQNNDIKTAAREYTKAAQLSNDVNIAEQAARLAMNAKMNELSRIALARWQVLAPNSSAMWAMNLRLAMQLGEAESAFLFARKLLSYGTSEYSSLLLDVLRTEKADNGVMSRAILRNIVSHGAMPDNIQIWIQILFLADALDEPIATQAISGKIAAKFPEDPRALLIGASVLREKGDESAALSMVQKASTLQPQNNWVKQNILAEYTQLHAWLDAEKYLANGPQDENTWLMRGRLIQEAGRQDLTEVFITNLLQQQKQPSQKLQLLLGQLSESIGRWTDAERWYRNVNAKPESERAQLRLPVVLQKQNRWNEALAQLRALQKNEDADGEIVRDSYLVEADLWAKRNNDLQAMKTLQRGLAIFESDPLLLYGRAMQHASQNRVNAALADLKKIIDDNNQNAEALNAYGYTLAQHKKQYAQALPYVEKALKLRPGSASTMDSLGWIKFMQRKYDEAQHWLEKAWRSSKDAEIAAHLGELYWVRGRKDDARKVWQLGQAIDPDYALWPAIKKKYSP